MPVITQQRYLPLAGYPVLSISGARLCALLQSHLEGREKLTLVFANTNFATQCQRMRPWLCNDDVAIVNDGVGMDIAALLKYGVRFPENLNGTDFVPHFFQQLSQPTKIFLLGGQPGVAANAAQVITSRSGHEVVGVQDGYTPIAPALLRAKINQSGAEVILVALGDPLQEEWIRDNIHTLNATLFVCVGALFDFLSGKAVRAPRWVQRARLEWFYRLLQEPKRLARRYSIDILRFLVLCLRYPRRQVGNLDVQTTGPLQS
jgi:beta-1,4-glucosyltransferase